jgi:hypothetical protein
MDKFQKNIDSFKKHLDNMSEDEKAQMKEYFKDDRPLGWLSIEDHLPMMYAGDIMQGYTEFKVRFSDGTEGKSRVSDHNIWYYIAKEQGVTHWLNEE